MAANDMRIREISILSAQAKQKAVLNGTTYELADVSVELAGNGVYVTTGETAISGVEIVLENIYFRDAQVLGDAFERGYAEFGWRKPDFEKKIPWYFIAKEDGWIYGLGVKTQPDSICSWQCGEEIIVLNVDMRNGRNDLALHGQTIKACELVIEGYGGDVYAAAQDFCRKMCDDPIRVDRPVFGGNDWYCNYGDNDFDSILLHAKRIVECCPKDAVKPFMVIDDGWQLCHQLSAPGFNGGPWLPNERFKDMKKMAEAIAAEGALPGIWYRPLQTVEFMPEEYVLKRNGMEVILDPSVPGVLDIVKRDVGRIRDWGYKLLKHDYSTFDLFDKWGFQMNDFAAGVEFADKTRTTAQIIKDFYQAIRDAAGDEMLIIGCNTISHLSAGLFEIQRTGDDTSGRDWQRTKDYGINTLAFRMAQHDTFYQADADCVGITNEVDWEKNRQWLDVLAKSGTPLFVSIAKDAYTEEVKADLKNAFEKAAKNRRVSRPLDWEDTMIPARWQSVFGEDVYNW